jgi:GTPase KRas protein
MAKEWGCPFIETSAKSRLNVEEAFFQTVREIRRFNREMSSTPNNTGKAGANGGQYTMDHEKEEKDGGCCGGCTVM